MLSQPAESCASTSVSTGETSVDGGVESRGVAIKRRLDSPRQACTHVAHTANHVRDQGDENAAGGYLGPARWAYAATAFGHSALLFTGARAARDVATSSELPQDLLPLGS
jgi:hypothetical protein